jgi:type III pantothenate kinase
MDAGGHHQGGIISPGLTLMKRSLAQGTHALQSDQLQHPVGLSKSTEAAIYSGTLCAAIGLIEHVISQYEKNVTLILTGGDAELIAKQLVCQSIVDDDLVLRGLAIMLAGDS